MPRYAASRIAALFAAVCIAALSLCAQAQDPPVNGAATGKIGVPGLPPRATPAEYQAHAPAGAVTIAAEFTGHSVPTPQGPLSSEEYVMVEVGLFGTPEARLKISADDFSLRINGKKTPLPSQPYGLVAASVKDPEWTPPEAVAEKKSKTSMGSSGDGNKADPNEPPPVVRIPIGVQRAMAQRVQKATLPEGDRALPQAGILYFQYRGKVRGIQSIELIYAGPAGKTTLALQP